MRMSFLHEELCRQLSDPTSRGKARVAVPAPTPHTTASPQALRGQGGHGARHGDTHGGGHGGSGGQLDGLIKILGLLSLIICLERMFTILVRRRRKSISGRDN